jgi:hypothetical protein
VSTIESNRLWQAANQRMSSTLQLATTPFAGDGAVPEGQGSGPDAVPQRRRHQECQKLAAQPT